MKSRTRSTPVRKSGRGRAARAASPPAGPAPKSGELALSAECTLAEAELLKAALAALLDEPQAVTLDAGSLQRIDTAALQLLAAFVRDRRLLGHDTRWRGAEPTLEPAARLLGMDGMLELPGESR
jgi:anti-anti-sigma regulatory factor